MELSWGIDLWDRLDELINHSNVTSNFIDKLQKCIVDCQQICVKSIHKQKRILEKLQGEIKDPTYSEFTMVTGMMSIINNFLSIYNINSTFSTSIASSNDEIFKKSHSQLKKATTNWVNDKKKMEDNLSKQRRKYDSSLKRYREKHQSMMIAQENYKKSEENKSLSRAQLDLCNQTLQAKKDEYNQSKQDYAVEFRDFNITQKDHFDSKVIKWAKKGEELYHQKLKLLKELAAQFAKLMSDTIGKLNYSVTRFSDVTKQVDFKKDAILLIQKYKTGDVPPLELQFIDMDYNQYSSTLAREEHSDNTSDDSSEFSSSNDSIDAVAPAKSQIHSTSNSSSIYTSSFSHDNRSEPIRPTPQNVKLRNTGTTVNPEAKFSIQKSGKIFKSSNPWKNNVDPLAKPTGKQPSLYRRGRNSTRQPQNSRRSRSVTDMISDALRSSLRLKPKSDKSEGKDCRERSPSNSQIVTSRQSISDFDSDTDVNQSKEVITRFAPDIVSTPAEAVADWKRQMSMPDFQDNERKYLTMNRSETPQSSKTVNSQSEEIYQEVYVGSCVSNHNFDSEDPSNNYLSFQAGDQFYIMKMDDGSGWLYVDTVDQTTRGYVPSSYMKICEFDNLCEAVV